MSKVEKKHGRVYFSLYALLTNTLFTSDVHTSPSKFLNVPFFHTGKASTGWNTTSFPRFSPTLLYGARERETLVGSGQVVPEQN